jgi:SAM domain (Sterile alpha motif)
MEIGNWLQSLGLGRYEIAFRESAIDAEVLHDLTDSDFEKLGVPVPVGNLIRLAREAESRNASAS